MRVDFVAEIVAVDHDRRARREVLEVVAVERNAGAAGLETRLAIVRARDHDERAAGERLLFCELGRDDDLEAGLRLSLRAASATRQRASPRPLRRRRRSARASRGV